MAERLKRNYLRPRRPRRDDRGRRNHHISNGTRYCRGRARRWRGAVPRRPPLAATFLSGVVLDWRPSSSPVPPRLLLGHARVRTEPVSPRCCLLAARLPNLPREQTLRCRSPDPTAAPSAHIVVTVPLNVARHRPAPAAIRVGAVGDLQRCVDASGARRRNRSSCPAPASTRPPIPDGNAPDRPLRAGPARQQRPGQQQRARPRQRRARPRPPVQPRVDQAARTTSRSTGIGAGRSTPVPRPETAQAGASGSAPSGFRCKPTCTGGGSAMRWPAASRLRQSAR